MAHKLSMSRSARITLLLVIDVVFFFVELIVGKRCYCLCFQFDCSFIWHLAGYAVGSLALVADSFHMLKSVNIASCKKNPSNSSNSDVMSLIVALYAIKVSACLHTMMPKVLHPHPLVDCPKCNGLALFVWVASRWNPCRIDQWRIPPCSVFLDIFGSYRTFLQCCWFVYRGVILELNDLMNSLQKSRIPSWWW